MILQISDNSPLHSSLHFPAAVAVFAELKPAEGLEATEDLTVQLQVGKGYLCTSEFSFHNPTIFLNHVRRLHIYLCQVTDHGQTRRSGHFGKLVAVQWSHTGSHSSVIDRRSFLTSLIHTLSFHPIPFIALRCYIYLR